MNKKHLACVVIILFILALVQTTLWMQGRMAKMQNEADRTKGEVSNTSLQLQLENRQLTDLQNSSKTLIEYLHTWQPYFKAVDSVQSAELKISLRIKEDNLVSLSQKYEAVGNPGNKYLPSIVRAQLMFEDDYARLLNWIGQLEADLPTVRTSSIRLSRGTSGNDLRMEIALEQPLLATP